jgi:hypothetical protein
MRYWFQDTGDEGGGTAGPELEEVEYFQRIEEHFGQRRGGPLVLSPKEWLLVQRWRKKGIPLAVVLRGINVAFDRFAASGPRPDRLNTLSYCAQHVEATWEEHRKTHAGSSAATGSSNDDRPSHALRHLRSVALACSRAGASLSSAKSSEALQIAARELDSLAARVENGELDAAALDRAANLLEQQLDKALAEAHPASASEPSDGRAELQIPRFSPYAI